MGCKLGMQPLEKACQRQRNMLRKTFWAGIARSEEGRQLLPLSPTSDHLQKVGWVFCQGQEISLQPMLATAFHAQMVSKKMISHGNFPAGCTCVARPWNFSVLQGSSDFHLEPNYMAPGFDRVLCIGAPLPSSVSDSQEPPPLHSEAHSGLLEVGLLLDQKLHHNFVQDRKDLLRTTQKKFCPVLEHLGIETVTWVILPVQAFELQFSATPDQQYPTEKYDRKARLEF